MEFLPIVLGVLIAIFLFFVLRGVLLWYWKIYTIVDNQDKQTKLLEEIVKKLGNRKESSERNE